MIYHGGVEYHHLPYPYIIKYFRFLIDVGADCVISHHTHRYSGFEYYKGKPISYGLGNFLSPTKTKPTDKWTVGSIAVLKIENNSPVIDVIFCKMTNSCKTVGLLTANELEENKKNLIEINSLIKDNVKLEVYWKLQNKQIVAKKLISIYSNSKFAYKIAKKLSKLIKIKKSNYKLKTMVNTLRCDSHRNRITDIINNELEKIK